jgi:2'-5' RNA ligase
MRLFVAINFNNDTRARLIELRDKVRSRSARGNFSAPENLHLTLAFLGECDAKQAAAAKTALGAVAFGPFGIAIDRVGRFKRGGGEIWWAGLSESKPLSDLQRGVTDRLASAGFAFESRKYSPHITLGREIVTDSNTWTIEPFGETVSIIDLMKSERIHGKLTYTRAASAGGPGPVTGG